MPNAPRTPSRNLRVHDLVWDASAARATGEGRTLSAVVVEFLEQYSGVTTPPLPSRRGDALVVCLACNGRGTRGRGKCRTCGGTGSVQRRKATELGWSPKDLQGA